MEGRVVCTAVTRLPGPYSPLPGLAPVVSEVPILVGGGRGAGAWPDHSYCSWRGGLGRQDWGAELGPCMINKVREGGRAGEWGGSWGAEDRAHLNQSEEHSSALSLYDNLPNAATPDSLQEVFDMETSCEEHWQGQMCQARAPQGLMDGEGASEDKSTRIQQQNPDQDKKREQDPELDSGSCGFKQLPLSPPQQHLTASSPQLSQTECKVLWPPADAQHPEQPSWSPRVPPPVPLADPSASALRSLLTSLQQQIVRQREEYEARILSLEQRNAELQVEVVRLKTNLTQQRHWYQGVQDKMAESERTRAAAELRNATLQKEMEQFFDTFGELNNEAKKTEYIVKSF
ncbi:rho GTPase-activating protein 24 [Anarrhichthys ocellatus]|uniref:rho GTPase-activating protein 24 n=1 Tax=Anarrhichthys ocellatus TaxID=433405 RepID=UPI0012EDB141|nr:rho GTPase-activating protein 24-like [Anarrhichthys ocellatus]